MNKARNNKMKKTWKLIGIFIVLFFVYYSFFYFPTVPTASIKNEHKTYELKAKDYDYSAFGKSITKNLTYKSVNELDTYLQNEPEMTVISNHHFTYKNSASTTATNIFFYSEIEIKLYHVLKPNQPFNPFQNLVIIFLNTYLNLNQEK
ncbi:hypothetical protein [Peribacillus sp. ACCC06369]|uniref:hypothetical protein n=1 Tax=Peribacillus sp. ACCC06369 TaxID=3055860 RepID=UPI0025A0C42A|nr:hypothetical protein [Peribacillus sp. ACCC06369]MDM5358402.1 hypothetical protein [Peribacillus sp. ACCC06369]